MQTNEQSILDNAYSQLQVRKSGFSPNNLNTSRKSALNVNLAKKMKEIETVTSQQKAFQQNIPYQFTLNALLDTQKQQSQHIQPKPTNHLFKPESIKQNFTLIQDQIAVKVTLSLSLFQRTVANAMNTYYGKEMQWPNAYEDITMKLSLFKSLITIAIGMKLNKANLNPQGSTDMLDNFKGNLQVPLPKTLFACLDAIGDFTSQYGKVEVTNKNQLVTDLFHQGRSTLNQNSNASILLNLFANKPLQITIRTISLIPNELNDIIDLLKTPAIRYRAVRQLVKNNLLAIEKTCGQKMSTSYHESYIDTFNIKLELFPESKIPADKILVDTLNGFIHFITHMANNPNQINSVTANHLKLLNSFGFVSDFNVDPKAKITQDLALWETLLNSLPSHLRLNFEAYQPTGSGTSAILGTQINSNVQSTFPIQPIDAAISYLLQIQPSIQRMQYPKRSVVDTTTLNSY